MAVISAPTRSRSLREADPGAGPALGASEAQPADPVHRAISVAAGLGLLWPAFKAWSGIVATPSAGMSALVLTGGILVLCGLLLSADSEARLRRLDGWMLALALLTLLTGVATTLAASNSYSTDEAAFLQGAAKLLLHGHDPYGANLTSSLYRYAVPQRFWTYLMGGGIASTYGYPSLPLLLTAPFVWLTGDGQAASWTCVCGLCLTAVVSFRALPSRWRGLAVIMCLAYPALSGLAAAGLNAILMLPLLGLALLRWDASGASGALTRGDRLRAVALGMAASANQLAWLVAPFVLVGIFVLRRFELGGRRATRIVGRYLGLSLAAFLLVNAPFMLWGPGAWLGGVADPLTQHALPYGQGLVGLTAFLHIGGGMVDAYGYAAAFCYVGLLAVFALRVRRLAGCCLVFPLCALFVSGRSLAEYWLLLGPVILLSIVQLRRYPRRVGAARPAPPALRFRTWWPAALMTPGLVCLGLALLTPAPLSIQVLGAHSDPASHAVSEVRLRVSNRSAHQLAAYFSTDVTGQASAFWHVVSGPSQLRPGQSAVLRLRPVDAGDAPPNGKPFLVQAISPAPRTISLSAAFTQAGPMAPDW